MNIQDEIRKGQQQQEDQIKKNLAPTFNEMKEDIIKGKLAQMGEIREWSGVKMRKEATGWVPVKSGDAPGKPENPEAKAALDKRAEQGKATAQPQDLGTAAKTASEAALMNATKVSTDPAVREAAHKELQRRKSEEAQDTFKAPEGEKDKMSTWDNKDKSKVTEPTEGPTAGTSSEKKKEEKPVEKKAKKAEYEIDNVVSFKSNGVDLKGTVTKVTETKDGDFIYRIKSKRNGNEYGGITSEDISQHEDSKRSEVRGHTVNNK